MNNTKTRKPDFQAEFRDETVEWEGKWINLHFLKSGESFPGTSLYTSQAEAKRTIDGAVSVGGYSTVKTACGKVYPFSMYSHTMQIPVGEPK